MRIFNKLLAISVGLVSISYLTGCGDSSTSDTTTSYFKFYNASLNAGRHELHTRESGVDEDFAMQANIDFADVSSPISQYTANYDIEIKRQDASSDDPLTVISSDFTLTENRTSLIALVGDTKQPELVELKYDNSSLEDLDPGDEQFELYVANFASQNNSLDIYYSLDDKSFSSATFLSSIQYKQLSDLILLNQDDYKFYLTLSGSNEVIFETNSVALDYLETFVLIIRDDFGINGLAIDKVTNSSVVTSYADEHTQSNLEFYTSKESDINYDVYLDTTESEAIVTDGTSGLVMTTSTLDADIYTLQSTVAGDKTQPLLTNLILDLGSDESKVVIMYQDKNSEYQGIVVDKLARQLVYENSIRLVNIGQEEQEINAYFIAPDESLDTAGYDMEDIDYAEHRKVTVLNQMYQIVIATEDDNDNLRSLYQSEFISFKENTNYLMILETDATSSSGYTLTILEE